MDPLTIFLLGVIVGVVLTLILTSGHRYYHDRY